MVRSVDSVEYFAVNGIVLIKIFAIIWHLNFTLLANNILKPQRNTKLTEILYTLQNSRDISTCNTLYHDNCIINPFCIVQP